MNVTLQQPVTLNNKAYGGCTISPLAIIYVLATRSLFFIKRRAFSPSHILAIYCTQDNVRHYNLLFLFIFFKRRIMYSERGNFSSDELTIVGARASEVKTAT